MLQQRSFQAKMSHPHCVDLNGPSAPKWYIVDATDQVVGRLATVLARVITGKHKPSFTRHVDTGDYVVVVNADKVAFTGNKWDGKLYRRHTGYISGLKTATAAEMKKKHPTDILKLAVWGMTGKNALASHQINKLKLFASADHTHKAQNPQPLPIGASRRTNLTRKRPANTK